MLLIAMGASRADAEDAVQERTVAALYYDGLSAEEIAKASGKPAATVRSHLRHARRALKEVIASEQSWPRHPIPEPVGAMMVEHGDADSADTDTYITWHLNEAAVTLTAHTDIRAKLNAIFRAGLQNGEDDTSTGTTRNT